MIESHLKNFLISPGGVRWSPAPPVVSVTTSPLMLARTEAVVALATRRTGKLAIVATEIEACDCSPMVAVAMDISERDNVIAAFDSVASQLGGPVDLLVNNAGVSDTKLPLDYTDEGWDLIIGTNLTGSWMATHSGCQVAESIVNINRRPPPSRRVSPYSARWRASCI